MNQAIPSNEPPLLIEQRDPHGVLTLTLNRPDQFNALSEAMACNMMSEDASEGIDAFFDKRKPQWKHR